MLSVSVCAAGEGGGIEEAAVLTVWRAWLGEWEVDLL